MIRGSCYCGAVVFELAAQPSMKATCHCSRCRKAGSSTFVFVKAADFRWIQGEDNVQRFAPTPPFTFGRAFCKTCGTALGEPGAGDTFPISAHALDDDPGVRNRFHEFVADKPAWYDIADDAKQFAGHPQKS
ncbi:MAG: GFA family protein [Alphaproteobacteria bacterium]|nr:GFA family protein [Alphaproteobacteria bacterium]